MVIIWRFIHKTDGTEQDNFGGKSQKMNVFTNITTTRNNDNIDINNNNNNDNNKSRKTHWWNSDETDLKIS